MLKQRAITAVVALIVLGVVLFVLPYKAAALVIAALLIAASWEWSGFLGAQGQAQRIAFVILLTALMCLLFLYVQGGEFQQYVLWVSCAWWMIAFLWTFVFPTPIPSAVRWLCGALVIAPTPRMPMIFLPSYSPMWSNQIRQRI